MPKHKRRHALSAHGSLIRFVNAHVTEENYLELAFTFLPAAFQRGIENAVLGKAPAPDPFLLIPYEIAAVSSDLRCTSRHVHGPDCVRSALRGAFKLAGGEIVAGGVIAIQEAIRRVLARYAEGSAEVKFPAAVTKGEFKVRGRTPLSGVEGTAEGGVLLTDLQDAWFVVLNSFLVDMTRKRSAGVAVDSSGRRLQYRPLARCRVWWKSKRRPGLRAYPVVQRRCDQFYFRFRPRQATCGRRKCVERQKYLDKTSRR